MLNVLAHAGQPPAPHDLWGAWNLDPILLVGLGLVAWAFERGRRADRSARPDGGSMDGRSLVPAWRTRCFTAAMAALAVALVSPLDAMASALASAHMVQHVLLVLVAAPLFALAAPSPALLRGTPTGVVKASSRVAHRLHLTPGRLRIFRQPVLVWLGHVATMWIWHAALPYQAALDHELVHVLEHTTFLVTGVLLWRVVVGPHRVRVSGGAGVLLVFALSMQSVFLSALLTFAETPWYPGYATTTAAWGLTPLDDQRLAGVIMWIPAGMIHVVAALALLAAWIGQTEREALARNANT